MNPPPSSVVLAGLECAGKSALFRGLTRQATGDEANFRGSTVSCRRCRVEDCQCEIVDTPGIQVAGDAATTRTALAAANEADVVLMVARGTHAVNEVETLLRELNLSRQKSALAITFRDKAPAQIEVLAQIYRDRLGIPVVVVNARDLEDGAREEVLKSIATARCVSGGGGWRPDGTAPDTAPVVQPGQTWFENRLAGPWLAAAAMLAMFGLPVYAAYLFAPWAQPPADAALIGPLKAALAWLPELPKALLTGGYGILTLGWYSFLWAFPVVLLVSANVAAAEETGLKDRISAALDPWLRRIGMSGRDLIPVLSGFGCNVVAVLQSRSCSKCTRGNCVSLISFGSACSYQIGASLSIFGAAGHPGLFLPYLGALCAVGALHTRLWEGRAPASRELQPLHDRAFLQLPSARAVWWRMRGAIKQFLFQAMPVFVLICLVGALLEHHGVITAISAAAAPLLAAFQIPAEAAPAILFSVLRKDGLLSLNSGDGALVTAMSAGQVFVVVWLASTLTACLVTVWTIRKELGWRFAARLAARQAGTSLATTWLISLML